LDGAKTQEAGELRMTDSPATADEKLAASDRDSLVGLPMPRRIDILSDLSLRPNVANRSKRRFPFPVPNGWFIVARADELEPGTKLSRHYFARDLVVYRAESGEVRVVDAYCPHLGAHLGVGGKVAGDSIRCPFHGWRFEGASGMCVEIPYAPDAKIPPRARLRSFPTLERNKMLWAWHHLEDKPPFYDVPDVPEFSDAEWSEPYVADFRIRTSCQEMAENNHDVAHFVYTHGTPAVPDEEMTIDGVRKHVKAMGGTFLRDTYGLGLGVLRFQNALTFLSSVTPIDEDNVHVRWSFTALKSQGENAAKNTAEAFFLSGITQDIPIWENKIYRQRPVLTKGESSIADHRRWSRQFYSDPANSVDRQEDEHEAR
jgi:nitrite reductase/ring-hydroxylating ferredoxin subunit